MHRSLVFLSTFATFSLFIGLSRSLVAQQTSGDGQTSQAAPIVRAYNVPAGQIPGPGAGTDWTRRPPSRRTRQVIDSRPIEGVWLRSDTASKLTTVSAEPKKAEFRLEHGRLNVTVHHPEEHAEILVDMPGGQTTLLKDGLYTFNADTNTVRVLRGEAAAYPGTENTNLKTAKIKTDHELSFAAHATNLKPVEAYPYELSADLLSVGNAGGYGYEGYEDPGFSPYGYPYYAAGWGYPWAFGYPYGYGIGFGYYGGFGRGFGGFRR